ncbi:MAG TPA: glutamate--tRNA ligase [Candidatus Competibacteraceae bacterium]|nr:glutamate--tRNA ligase [Candidatus Competibacteraceae bacterium]
MESSPVKTRFAPSPTGLLHLGNLRTALFNALWARRHGGVFLLRIEDTDLERSRAEYVTALQQDLRWLGLDWQEGPEVGGAHGPYAQSERGAVYQEYYRRLERQGLVYPCFCTPQELELSRKAQLAAGRPPRYSGRCAQLSEAEREAHRARGLQPTLRFRVPLGCSVEFQDLVRGAQHFQSDDIGDFIIRRADGGPQFFFCNAVDDALMGVTHVLRGEDHLTNTPRQILLLQALDLPVPRYGHISMILGHDGSPLSKRHGSRSLAELRAAGYLPGALNNYLARLGHSYEQDPGWLELDGLAAGFDLTRLGRAAARYDQAQLDYWQGEAVARLDDEALWAWMGQAVHAQVPVERRAAFLAAVRPNVRFPADARFWAERLFAAELEPDAAGRAVLETAGPVFFEHALAAYDAHGANYPALIETLKARTGAKGKALFMPLRVALTGEMHGPELARILALLPEPLVRQRLERCCR